MKINSIELKCFKGFEDSGKVPIGSVTSIIGRNGHGKTTLIEAIKNSFNYEQIDPNSEQRNGTDKNPLVCLECEITSKDGISGITSDTNIEIVRTRNNVVGSDKDKIKQIFDNTNIITQPEKIQNPLSINLSNGQDKAPIKTIVNEMPGWKNIFGNLSITPDYIKNQLRNKGNELQFEEDFINDLAKDFTENFNEWTINITKRTYEFQIAFEVISESSLRAYMMVRHKLPKSNDWSKWARLEQKSESFKILLTLASHTYSNDGRPRNHIFLFDEPFVNMHPSMQVEVMNILREYSQHNQIIYTTHSPYLKQENNSLFCIEDSPDSFVIKTEDQLDPDEKKQYIDDFSLITPFDLQRIFEIQHQIPESNKKLICYVEGKTDVGYIKHVLNVHDKKHILNNIDIFDWQGQGNLNKTFDVEKYQREKENRITPQYLRQLSRV